MYASVCPVNLSADSPLSPDNKAHDSKTQIRKNRITCNESRYVQERPPLSIYRRLL